MSAEQRNGEKLLEGIAEEARREAKKLREEAERQAEEIVKGAEKRAKQSIADAESAAEEQAETIGSRNRKSMEAERRRLQLEAEERLFTKAYEMLKDRLEKMKTAEEYPEVLRRLIIEGALGLGISEAKVNASAEERNLLSDTLLRAAEKELEKKGLKVSLSLSKEPPIDGQGVVVEENGGRLSFNNRMDARMRRYAAEIRRMIYQEIREEPQEA
jgi:V/A-type H+/Na+-transporting ATPase subunit E